MSSSTTKVSKNAHVFLASFLKKIICSLESNDVRSRAGLLISQQIKGEKNQRINTGLNKKTNNDYVIKKYTRTAIASKGSNHILLYVSATL